MKFVFLILFFLILIVSTFLSRPLYMSFIQEDLEARIQRNFSEKGIEGVVVEFDHLHATLNGQSPANQSLAVNQVDRVWGAYIPEQSAPPALKPLGSSWLSAQSQGDTVLLQGDVPNEEVRKQIVLAAQSADGVTAVKDDLKIAEVDSAVWANEASHYIPGLFGLSKDGRLKISDEGVYVSGMVENQELHDQLSKGAEGLPNNEISFNEELEVQTAKAASLIAQRQDDTLHLQGEVPNEGVRNQIVRAAEGIEGITTVTNDLQIAEVGSAVWADDAERYIPSLFGPSKDGRLRISNEGVYVSGIVESQELHDQLREAARGLPNSEIAFNEELEILGWQDPNWQVTGTPDKVVIEGLLPDEETQKALYETTVSAYGAETEIEDRTTIAERVRPAWWGDHAGRLLPQLAENGTTGSFARYEPTSVTARCTAPSEPVQADMESLVRAELPDGVTALPQIALAAKEPAPDLAGQLKLLPVYFGTDSSEILAKEIPKIEKAADVIKQTGGNDALTVGGYADLRGSAEYNRALSLRRANAVRSRLISLGVSANRLEVNHFGEDTSEVADEDLWKSRRVELSITPAN